MGIHENQNFGYPIFKHPVKNIVTEVTDYLTVRQPLEASALLSQILEKVKQTTLQEYQIKGGESMWVSDLGYCKVSFDGKSETPFKVIPERGDSIECWNLAEVMYIILRRWW